MAFFGMMLVRDEDDVIGQCLDHLLSWIDGLFILDLGSTDSTWEILRERAQRDKRVVLDQTSPILYSDNLRSYLFDAYRSRFSAGDWVMKIDADEFYHVPPPAFVKDRMTKSETAAHLQWYFFRLTRGEVAGYESGAVDLAEDRKRPISERRRFYKISEYAEPRMFKYRRAMKWPAGISFPYNAGFVARERLPIRHYPHRDPAQMAKRYRLRAAMMKLKAHAGGHWKLEDWRAEVVDDLGATAAGSGANKVGLSGESGIDTGELLEWKAGEALREVPLHNHVPGLRTRLMKRVIHPLLLPILDRTRGGFGKDFAFGKIPDEVQKELAGGG